MKFKTSDLLNYRQLWWLDKFLVGHKGFIAGGCFKNIFNNEHVKDLDIFFESEQDFLEAKRHFNQQMKDEPQSWRFSYENKNCWSVYSVKDKVRYPVSTFNRLMRYVKYGYQPCREAKIRIVTSLAMLDPKNQQDFEEQLGKSLYEGMD